MNQELEIFLRAMMAHTGQTNMAMQSGTAEINGEWVL